MSHHFDFGAFDAADASYLAEDAGYGYGGADYFGISGSSAYPPYAASLNGQSTDVAQAPPLQVTHVGPTLLRAGVEIWLQALIRFLDPRRVRIVRCLVTMPKQIDPRLARELGAPVEIGDRQSVRLAARESDVILCWGPCELGHWLAGCRPKLCVFVAHGEGYWTRHMLQACAPV